VIQNKTIALPQVDTFELKRKMIEEKKKLEEKMKVMMAQKEKA
jgi:adenylate kinase family enzyme